MTTVGTGNVVTAVGKTGGRIVVTKGASLYDWAQQPNKPTYSLAEINNVSGTYTALTAGKAQNADYATNAGYATSAGTAANTNAFFNKDIYHYQEAGWISLTAHKYIDGTSYWYWNKIATVTDNNTNYSGIVIEIEAIENYVCSSAVYSRLYITCGEGATSLNLMTVKKSKSQRELYIQACIDAEGNVWVKTNVQWKNQFRYRIIGKDYLYIDTYTGNIETTPDKPANTSNAIENAVVVLKDGSFTYFDNTCTLWGQPFDGTGNIRGDLTDVGNITMSGNLTAQGSVTALTTSDKRLKCDFDYTVSYIDRLLAMGKVCDFRYTQQARERDKGGVDENPHTGLIYQEAKEILPSMAYETADGYGALNYLSPDYINTIAGAAQETARLVKNLRKEIDKLKRELSKMKGKENGNQQ